MPPESPSAPPAARDLPAELAVAARREPPASVFAPLRDATGEEKLAGEMLLLTTGLMGLAAVLWVATPPLRRS